MTHLTRAIHHVGMTVLMAVTGLFLIGKQSATAQIANGTYKIVNRNSGQVLNVGGTANKTRVVQNPYDGQTTSQWTVTSMGGGQYKILNVASGRSLNVHNNSTTSDFVQLYDYQSTAEDLVTLVDEGGGYYSLVFSPSGMALQVSNDTTTLPNGSLAWNQYVIQDSYSATTANAQWEFLATTDGSTAGVPFAICTLPDTQKECETWGGSTPQMFYDQTGWMNTHQVDMNIVYVAGLGDIVNDDAPNQHLVARTALYALDSTIPYGTVPGNHDYDPPNYWSFSTDYEADFGLSHFIGKSYYGGHNDTVNNNHYDLISASGMDLIIVYMQWHISTDTNSYSTIDEDIKWVNDVLHAYPNRTAIFVTHELMNAATTWSTLGQQMYDGLKGNPNLALMLCGHVAPCLEAVRADTYNGHTIYTMMADYQDSSAPDYGGMGILRYIQFIPKENLITSRTYCVETNTWMSQFSVPFQMHGAPALLTTVPAEYQIINAHSGLAIDLKLAGTAEGATIDQETYTYGSQEQRWNLVPSENIDHFKIISTVTGKALSVSGDSTAPGALAVDDAYVKNDSAQQWDLVDAGNGWFNIRNVNSGLYLDDRNGGTTSGTGLWQYTGNTTDAQKWRLQPYGIYYVKTSSGNYVSTQASGSTNGTPVVQYTGTDGSWFHWQLNSVGDGNLEVAHGGGAISVTGGGTSSGGSTTAGAAIDYYTYNAANPTGQQVQILPLTNGLVKFYWVHDGMSWDIPGNSTSVNTVLQQAVDVPDSAEQEFSLLRRP